MTYAQVLHAVRSLGQALLERGLDPEHPVMLLSGNSVDNALVQLAAMEVGVPAAPISPAYSLVSQDLSKVRYICDLLTPGLVYAADGAAFDRAVRAIDPDRVVVGVNPRDGDEILSDLLATPPGRAVADAAALIPGRSHPHHHGPARQQDHCHQRHEHVEIRMRGNLHARSEPYKRAIPFSPGLESGVRDDRSAEVALHFADDRRER